MAFLIINPNSSEGMTRSMLAAARAAVPAAEFEGWTSAKGPPAIQGAQDGEAATPPLLELVEAAGNQADGIVIGCFDDTGLALAAKLSQCPVIGIGQAAFHHAALRGWRFSVVTTLAVSVPVIEANIDRYLLRPHLGRVRASGVPVLDLEADVDASIGPIVREARAAELHDEVDCIILGCAGMVHATEATAAEVALPVIDPVKAAARLLVALT